MSRGDSAVMTEVWPPQKSGVQGGRAGPWAAGVCAVPTGFLPGRYPGAREPGKGCVGSHKRLASRLSSASPGEDPNGPCSTHSLACGLGSSCEQFSLSLTCTRPHALLPRDRPVL